MKKFINITAIVVMLCMLATMACGCSSKSNEDETTSESTVAETTIATEEETSAEATTTTTVAETTSEATEATSATTAEATTTEATAAAETEAGSSDVITDEMAYDAIHNRCVLENSEFASLGADNWVIISSDDDQIVVLFTSYTGSENRYYIDRATGNTTVTELVPGIIDEEQSTGESFNVKDYLTAEIYG